MLINETPEGKKNRRKLAPQLDMFSYRKYLHNLDKENKGRENN